MAKTKKSDSVLMKSDTAEIKLEQAEALNKVNDQITAQEMYIKELEKTASSLREQREKDVNVIAELSKVIQQFEENENTLKRNNNKFSDIIVSQTKDIEHLENKSDEAYREQEQMLKELKRWLDAFPYAFKQLEEHAGKITSEDVTYHANLISKIMEHKFGYKTKMEEI